MRILALVHYDRKTRELFGSTNTGRLNLYRNHSTKYETVAKIQDKQVATICNNDVYVIKIFWFPKVWPTVTGGRLTRMPNFTGFTYHCKWF